MGNLYDFFWYLLVRIAIVRKGSSENGRCTNRFSSFSRWCRAIKFLIRNVLFVLYNFTGVLDSHFFFIINSPFIEKPFRFEFFDNHPPKKVIRAQNQRASTSYSVLKIWFFMLKGNGLQEIGEILEYF